MPRFFYAGYDVVGDTDNVATAYIHGGDGWQRDVALELGEDAPLVETVDVSVASGGDGYATCKIYHDGRVVDAVEFDGVVYAIHAAVPS